MPRTRLRCWTPALRVLLATAWLSGCVAPGRPGPGHYAWDNSLSAACRQNPAYCAAPAGEEPFLSPSLVTGLTVAASTAGATAVTVLEFNDQEREAIEQVLLRCAQEAERTVNRRVLGEDRPPRRDECRKLVQDEFGNQLSQAALWGREKHKQALPCVLRELGPRFPGRILIEQRYRYYKGADHLELVTREQEQRLLAQGRLHELQRTFAPDIVIIFDGNAFWIQAVYDFKFPCPDTNTPQWNSYPDTSAFRGSTQDKVYRDALKVDPVIVTPQEIF